MLAQVEQAEFVLVVCTPTSRRRFDGNERRGKGLGATFEGLLARQLLYESGTSNRKLVPVLFPRAAAERAVPLPLRSFTHFRVPAQLDDLVEHLLGHTAVEPAQLGNSKTRGRRAPVRSEGAGDVSISREELLAQLLLSLFSDAEFRRWLAHDTDCAAIANKLPGAAASPEDLVHTAIEAMVRVGLIDTGLFERLLQRFPRRDAAVRHVAQIWGVTLGATPKPPARQPSATKASARKTSGKNAATTARQGRSTPATPIVVEGGIVMGKGALIGGHAAGGNLVIHEAGESEQAATKKRRART